SRRTRLPYQPAIARPHRALDAGRAGPAVPHRGAGIRHGHEVARVPGDQPDGQGAGDRTPWRGGDRGAAICAYLADAFPEAGLAPATDDPLRGTWYRWMF